jgi:hypothetical protein
VAEVIDRARNFVDSARNAVAALALWLTISMLAGAFSASAAAIEGGQLRDGTWKAVNRLDHTTLLARMLFGSRLHFMDTFEAAGKVMGHAKARSRSRRQSRQASW